MKALLYSLVAGAVLLASCAKDNVDPPSSMLTGRIIYQDQVVGVRSNASQDLGNRSTMLELWQPGYAFFEKIPIYVNQDGTFSASLFDGDYQMVRTRGNGPWVDNTDTIAVQVRGNTAVDVPVQPYFTIQNAAIQRNGATVTATCRVRQEVSTRTVDQATLFISRTQFVDNVNNTAQNAKNGTAVADLSKELSFSVAVPNNNTGPVYARIGVRASGTGEFIFTPVQKLE